MSYESIDGESFEQRCTRMLFSYITESEDAPYYLEHASMIGRIIKIQTSEFVSGRAAPHSTSLPGFYTTTLSAAAKDIRWWKVKEGTPETAWEHLAASISVQPQQMLIASIPDWVSHPRLRTAHTPLNTFCQEGTRIILKGIDWGSLAQALQECS